jgi:spore coat protein CotF
VNEMNAVNLSNIGNSTNVPNTSLNPCNNNVNAGSVLYANNSDLGELTLPTFTDSTSQVSLHFIRDLDQYFSLRKNTRETKVSFGFPSSKGNVRQAMFVECLRQNENLR